MSSLTRIGAETQKFNSDTYKILEKFNLLYYFDIKSNVWSRIFHLSTNADKSLSAAAMRNLSDFRAELDCGLFHLTAMASLLAREHESDLLEDLDESVKVDRSSYLRTTLPDDDATSPKRLTDSIESIALFYKIFEAIVPEDDENNREPLSIVSIDSGSDKSFDFFGAAKLIECIKELILQIWDRLVFHRVRSTSEKIKLVSQSLPVIAQIEKLAETDSIPRETAERLKRDVTHAVSKFIESGTSIPEFENVSTHPTNKILSSIPARITLEKNANESPSDKAPGNDISGDDISGEDMPEDDIPEDDIPEDDVPEDNFPL